MDELKPTVNDLRPMIERYLVLHNGIDQARSKLVRLEEEQRILGKTLNAEWFDLFDEGEAEQTISITSGTETYVIKIHDSFDGSFQVSRANTI